MNARLKELAEQAGLITNQDIEENNHEYMNDLERFAKLIHQDFAAIYLQAITDPENQPSQFGTVTVEYMEQEINRKINNKVT